MTDELTPKHFKGQDIILGAPVGWDAERDGICVGLPVKRKDGVCTSLWGLTIKQRILLLFTGEIWLHIFSGDTQPPVMLNVSGRGDKQ